MNNITQFPSVINYPQLNVATLRQAANSASDAGVEVKRLFIQTNYLPTLHARVTHLDKAMRDAHFKLRETVLSIDIKLAINTKTLRGYQAELDGATASDRREILEDIAQRTSIILDLINKEQTTLKRLHAPMKEAVDRNATRQYLEQLGADLERLPIEILETKGRLEKLAEKRQSLTEAMALIESKGFAQVGKDTLLNAQEITKLSMAGPEVAVIEKAIALAQETLEKLETLINYFGLMDARNTVRKQMDDLEANTRDKTEELRLIGLKGDLITASHHFDDYRNLYTNEFEKIIAANDSFLSVYRSINAEDEQTITQFVVDALALAKHLKVVA